MKKEKPVKSEERAHAKIGPSSLRGREICPAYESDDSGEKTAANEGDVAHELMELHLRLNSPKEAANKDELRARFDELWTSFDESQRGHVNKMIDYVNPYISNAKAIHPEISLDLRFLQVAGCEHGTADAVIESGDGSYTCGLDLFDWKFGRIEVDDAETNVQFHAYALAAMRKFDQKRCRIHGLQPKRDEVTTHEVTLADEAEIITRIRRIVLKANEPEPERHPADTTCIWCKHLGKCEAASKYTLNTVGVRLHPLANVSMEQVLADPALAAHAYAAATIIEKWATDVKARVVQMAAEGNEISAGPDGPSFRLVTTKGRRSCIDNVGLFLHLRESYGITPELFMSWCSVSLSKLEAELGKTAPRGQQGKAADQVAQEIAELGFVQSGNPTMFLSKKKGS